MFKFLLLGLFAFALMLLNLQVTKTFGQTTTPSTSPTVTTSPSPTGSVEGAAVVPSGAPATGFGK